MQDEVLINPYKIVLKRKILNGFHQLSRGNYKSLTKLFSDNIPYSFEGNHALGGERFTKKTVELWFERLLRLLP